MKCKIVKMAEAVVKWSSTKVVALSGGVDPIHVGHLRMMQDASTHGDVIVMLNSDEWLMRKKGYVFMPWDERAEILQGLACVTSVIAVDDSDGSVVEGLKTLRAKYEYLKISFGNGGDRTDSNTPEQAYCNEHGIDLIWNLGGGKVQSSSTLVENANKTGAGIGK